MDRSETESFIEKFYAARVEGDMTALEQAFDENVKFQIAGSPEVSMLATCVEGHDDVMSLVRTMVDSFSLQNFEILDLLIDGEKAAVRWRATVNRMGSGETYETEIADVIEIRGGKIVSFIEFLDTALAG